MSRELISRCCKAPVAVNLEEGMLIGKCSKCGKPMVRGNPNIGYAAYEWLEGKPIHTTEVLEQVKPDDFNWKEM